MSEAEVVVKRGRPLKGEVRRPKVTLTLDGNLVKCAEILSKELSLSLSETLEMFALLGFEWLCEKIRAIAKTLEEAGMLHG
ncbi:MAG: hypothetical protein QW175_04530 [Candidatus Bathyarchaeia archaeon]